MDRSSPPESKAAPAVADIIVADDHVAIAMTVLHVAQSNFSQAKRHVVDSGDALLDLLEVEKLRSEPMVVLDLHMPGRLRSLGLITAVKKVRPDSHVLVYSGQDTPCLVAAALEAGADGYVPKAAPLHTLEAAMATVSAGGRYVPESIDLEEARKHPWNRLTAGERDVLSRLARGNSLQDIADASHRSYSTVSAQKYSGLRKLQMSADDALLTYLMEEGLSYVLEKNWSPHGLS